jgi:3-(3-hydroxy-phenyl)propionate hydroxylase
MLSTYTYPTFAYRRAPELDQAGVSRRPVVVVGAGPVGLAAAIDLAQLGQPVLLLDEDDTVSVGSRGLCYAKRAIEILDRLGCGDPVVERGVTWNVGRTFHRTEEVFRFDLLPESGHRRPGMVNLQQYHLEEMLVRRAGELPGLELRWRHKVVDVVPQDRGVRLTVDTADGRYALDADWLVVCDGARSPIRRMLGLDIEGQVFRDRFLIADVVLEQPLFPEGKTERWFWFDPPFHPGQSVLLHREADNVWRIDFQLGWDADPEEEKKPERVIPRIRAMLAHGIGGGSAATDGGEGPAFELEWVSVYTFQCRRMQRFRHGRVLFAGDAAHQVSPFGARGANSGLQDTDNLCWKLKLVIDGLAPERLLDSYSDERVAAADENLVNSTRSTDFITPKSPVSRDFRQAVLGLAREHAFARALVNSGRLSVPAHLADSALNTPDVDAGAQAFGGTMAPGAPMADAPVRHRGRDGWLLEHAGNRFVLLVFAGPQGLELPARDAVARLADARIPVTVVPVLAPGRGALDAPLAEAAVIDRDGLAAQRYDARPGTCVLLRPDQHVAARWRRFDVAAVQAAVARATGNA